MRPRIHHVFTHVLELARLVAGLGAGSLVSVWAVQQDGPIRFVPFLLMPPYSFAIPAFIAGAWLARRVPATCECGRVARRISSLPAVYACSEGHEAGFETNAGPLDAVRDALDARSTEDFRRRRAFALEGRLSAPDAHQGQLSAARENRGLALIFTPGRRG